MIRQLNGVFETFESKKGLFFCPFRKPFLFFSSQDFTRRKKMVEKGALSVLNKSRRRLLAHPFFREGNIFAHRESGRRKKHKTRYSPPGRKTDFTQRREDGTKSNVNTL